MNRGMPTLEDPETGQSLPMMSFRVDYDSGRYARWLIATKVETHLRDGAARLVVAKRTEDRYARELLALG